MAGRTWLQHATPITFGLKCAGWLDGTLRARARLRDAVADASVLQFGGASGTLAALGADGEAVTTALAARLGLRTPDMPWHVERDRLAQVGAALGIACGTLGKIARDLSLLAQTEVGEARDRDEEGVGGSSTMPHKRNPVRAAVALTAATRAPGLVATLLAAMVQEHERGLGGWQAEWTTLPELLGLTSGAARTMAELLEHLVVDAHAMRARLIESDGYMLAESVATALAPSVGRDEAHRLVEEVCRAAIDGRQPLAYALLHDARVTHALPPQAIAQALDPAAYLGTTATFIRNVLARYDASVTLA
jgi:3-carboxy-cis,cis-muconate cycloisomerase